MSGFDVLICSTCTQTWIQPEVTNDKPWRAQTSVTCPHCDTEHTPSKVKVLKSLSTREAAGEWRSRYHAKDAEKAVEYNDLTLEFGQYGDQEDEIRWRIEAFVDDYSVNLEVSDFDRFDALVDVSMDDHRERYADLADEWCTDPRDEYAGLVSLEDSDFHRFDDEIRDDLERWVSSPERDDLARGEVTPTDQAPASRLHAVSLTGETTVTSLWEQVFDSDQVRVALANSVREMFVGADVADVYETLEELGVPYWIRSEIVNATRGDLDAAFGQLARELVPSIHENPLASIEDVLACAQLFAGCDGKTLAVTVDEQWLERRRDQRIDVCDLLAVLADSLEVRVVASGLTLSKVANTHRVDLPGVSEWCNRQRDSPRSDETAKAWAEGLSKSDFAYTMLRELYNDPSGILSYSELYDLYSGKDTSHVRILAGEFEDDGLVSRFGPRTDRMVELLPAGERTLELFERETARQRSISDFVNFSRKQQQQGRVFTQTGLGQGGDGRDDGEDGPDPYRTRYLSRAGHAAIAGCGKNGGVTLVRGGIEDHENKTRYVSYDENRGEAVVAVRAGEPLPLVTSAALALASPEFVDRVLTPTQLESIDEDAAIMRDARCIGGASDDALADGQEFRDKLIRWGEDLSRLTTKLKRGEYDDRDEFRSAIVSNAHGLWDTIVDILEVLDITLHREIRVPEGLKCEKIEDFAASISHAVATQSLYGAHSCYRHLYEDRPEKREAAHPIRVDAADPTGSLCGSFVLRGPDVHRFEDDLRDALESPRELHDDAPEFGIEVTVRSQPSREAYAEAMRRVLSAKRIQTTEAAVSVAHALIATPQDMTHVLHRYLRKEDDVRPIRPDELRRAFSELDASALLPDVGTSERRTDTAGKLAKALLEADRPLSKSELAERADVSKKTIYNYGESLESLGILIVDDDGYRLALSFPTKEERRNPVLPAFATGSFLEAVDALLADTLPPGRYGDPSDPIGSVLFYPQEPWRLLEIDEYAPWVRVAAKLTGSKAPESDSESLLIGPEISQQSLETAVRQATAD